MAQWLIRQHVAHHEREERERQDEAHPEPACHVDQLGVRPFLGGDGDGLQRHTADRAVTRALLTDLRVHGTGVDAVLVRWLRRRHGDGIRIPRRVGEELFPATVAAEPVGGASVIRAPAGRLARNYIHPADRVLPRRERRAAGVVLVPVVVAHDFLLRPGPFPPRSRTRTRFRTGIESGRPAQRTPSPCLRPRRSAGELVPEAELHANHGGFPTTRCLFGK